MVKLQLRLPDSIHNKIRKIAKKEKVSIDRLLVNYISNEIVRYETIRLFEERSQGFDEAEFLSALQEIPDSTPIKKDSLDSG